MATRICKDCREAGVTTQRPAPHPGPRCVTHHRAQKRAQRERSRLNRDSRVYGLGPGVYDALKAVQGGVCAGCGHRTGRNGRTKRLAVDHRHRDDAHGPAGEVRGLLCSTCNRMLGAVWDDPRTLRALADYLDDPPARRVLGDPTRGMWD